MRRTILVGILVGTLVSGCVIPSPNPPPKPIVSDKLAIGFYGDGDAITSGGIDTILSDLRGIGYETRTYTHKQADKAAREIDGSRATKIVLIGNSFGVRAVRDCADQISGKYVFLVASLDGSEPATSGGSFLQARPLSAPFPPNVQRLMVWCNPDTPLLNVAPCPRVVWAAGTHADVFITHVFHTQIDDDPAIRAAIVEAAR